MKFVSIFAEYLFAFHYDDEIDNEYDRLMDLWTDVGYLQSFAKQNNIPNVYEFIDDILANAEEIQNFLDFISKNSNDFCFYFEPLQESEAKKILSFQKGKVRKNRLRLYALKISEDCFVITGGAIKMSQKMDDHPETKKELVKLKSARVFLNENGVFDDSSFFEFISE